MEFRDEVSALHVDLIDEPGRDLDWLPMMILVLYAVANALILFQHYVFLPCNEDLSLLPSNHL